MMNCSSLVDILDMVLYNELYHHSYFANNKFV